jgi:lactoylglutathione lyase
MISIKGLFETHLTVCDLNRSAALYGDVLELSLAARFDDRRCAFYRVGPNRDAMIGLWEVGNGPQRMQLHTAIRVDIEDLLSACDSLRRADVVPLDFTGHPTSEPTVLCWMPAVAVYFLDPDGNLLEFLAMLPEAPRPELGIVNWSRWKTRTVANAPSAIDCGDDGGST